MRLAVLADIHGNLPALEAVLSDAQQHHVDGFIVAGDHLTGGPQPMETLRRLRSLPYWLIRGNTDNYLLDYEAGRCPAAWYTSKQWEALRWTYQHLDRETLDFLASLPEQQVVTLNGATTIRVVHGSPQSPLVHTLPDRNQEALRLFQEAGLLAQKYEPVPLEQVWRQIPEPVLICGHTHIPWQQEGEGHLACNPGAVSGSLNGEVGAQYALLTWQDHRWQVEHRVAPYDLGRLRALSVASGYLAEGGAFAQACLLNAETGRNVPWNLILHFLGLAEKAGFMDGDVIPDAIWDQATKTFDWPAAGLRDADERR